MSINNKVRIISGLFKGYRLNVLDVEGLRPTTDKNRETIFNLLKNKFEGGLVLDLYAGSGALGLEALSRGALSLTLVEKDRNNYLNLQNTIKELQKSHKIDCSVEWIDALEFLATNKQEYDLIFIDPPFSLNLLDKTLSLILEHNALKKEGFVYIEYPEGHRPKLLGYQIVYEKQSSNVRFIIAKKSEFLNF